MLPAPTSHDEKNKKLELLFRTHQQIMIMKEKEQSLKNQNFE
jgi:hypothetical protein